jgi:hypothetical protein
MFYFPLDARHRTPRCPMGNTAYCNTGDCAYCQRGSRKRPTSHRHRAAAPNVSAV